MGYTILINYKQYHKNNNIIYCTREKQKKRRNYSTNWNTIRVAIVTFVSLNDINCQTYGNVCHVHYYFIISPSGNKTRCGIEFFYLKRNISKIGRKVENELLGSLSILLYAENSK